MLIEGAMRNFIRSNAAAALIGAGSIGAPIDRANAQATISTQVPFTRISPSDIKGSTFMEQLTWFIKQNEGIRRYRYLDSSDNWTIGIGHHIQPGEVFNEPLSDEQIDALFSRDIQRHINRARRLLPEFDSYPDYVKIAIVDGVFRGDLSGSPNTLRLIRQGKWLEASKEYLNNNEYRKSKQQGVRHGVWQRMERNASLLAAYAKEIK